MPRQRRLIGPRKKINIQELRNLSRDERLQLLMRSVVECGGRSELEWGAKFRGQLNEAARDGRQRVADQI